MRLIKPSYEIIDIRPRGIVIPDDMEIGPRYIREEKVYTIYRQIEAAGKTYYKSEDKPTRTSAEEFVNEMIKSKDYGILEFGTVYLECPVTYFNVAYDERLQEDNPLDHYNYDDHSRCNIDTVNSKEFCYVTTNYRVLVENNWLSDLKYICDPTEFHDIRACVKFTCDIELASELMKYRAFSFVQEPAMYCNYFNGKFTNDLVFVIPSWIDLPEGIYMWEDQNPFLTAGGDPQTYGYDDSANLWKLREEDETYEEYKRHYDWQNTELFCKALQNVSDVYFELLSEDYLAQRAIQVLPNATKTEINMCGFISDWERLFKSQSDIHSYLWSQVLIERLHDEFKKKFKIK